MFQMVNFFAVNDDARRRREAEADGVEADADAHHLAIDARQINNVVNSQRDS